jgi:hypothetical protein
VIRLYPSTPNGRYGIYEQLYAPKSLPQAPSDLQMSRLFYSQSVSNTSIPSSFHSAASRRLAKARAPNPVSPSSSSSSSYSTSPEPGGFKWAETATLSSPKSPPITSLSHVRAAIVSAPSAPQNEPSPTIETDLAALQLRQYSCRRGG